uniref:Uncharacterized protein n=1 Tax=Aegilops tauschii subsp. strangulata TaxID=200361 RepID=A0A452XUA2_AEGTS
SSIFMLVGSLCVTVVTTGDHRSFVPINVFISRKRMLIHVYECCSQMRL